MQSIIISLYKNYNQIRQMPVSCSALFPFLNTATACSYNSTFDTFYYSQRPKVSTLLAANSIYKFKFPERDPTRVKSPKTAMKRSWKRSASSPKANSSPSRSLRMVVVSAWLLADPVKKAGMVPRCLRSSSVRPSSKTKSVFLMERVLAAAA